MTEKLQKIECECHFMVKSHNEKELVEVAIQHWKKIHNSTLTEKDAKAKIEPA